MDPDAGSWSRREGPSMSSPASPSAARRHSMRSWWTPRATPTSTEVRAHLVLVRPDGSVRQVADGLRWPNGMALVDRGRTLVVADSHAEQLVGFDVAADGTLGRRRVWAAVAQAPDGICADADGAIWFASVPGRQCVRVGEGGGVLDTVDAGRACFACMLGGQDGRTLFMATAEWRGMDVLMTEGPGRTGRLFAAAGQPAPHAGRP